MFYHSHMSFQRGDGLFGPYIVRQPLGQDPNENLYDFDLTEHFIFPQEWFHAVSKKNFHSNIIHVFYRIPIFPGNQRSFCTTSLVSTMNGLSCILIHQILKYRDTGKNKADNMLINGMGRSENGTKTPYASFHVKSGYRYRFRIVSPGFTLCPIQVSVENHTLTLIASDTESIEPVEVNSFILHEGER